MTIIAHIYNASEQPVQVGEFATANVRFINPAVSQPAASDADVVARQGLSVDSADPIQPERDPDVAHYRQPTCFGGTKGWTALSATPTADWAVSCFFMTQPVNVTSPLSRLPSFRSSTNADHKLTFVAPKTPSNRELVRKPS